MSVWIPHPPKLPTTLDLQLHILFDIIVAHATCCSCTCACKLSQHCGKTPQKGGNMQQWGIAKNAASCMCVHKFTAAVVSVWLFRCLPLLFASSNEDMTPTKNEDTSCNCNIPLAFSCTQNSENKNYIKNLISIAEMRRNLIYMRKFCT